MSPGKTVILGTGGTIAGTAASAHDSLSYTAAQLGVEQLVAAIPALAGVSLATEQVAQIDSKDMDFDVWRSLALRCAHWLAQPDVSGVVVTHGTDTIEETAYLLHRVLAPAKPVVLTCAMRPATALMPDGPQNLLDAMAVARSGGIRGVLVACAGAIHDALAVTKQHAWRLDAFGSGDDGPLAWIEGGAMRVVRSAPRGDEHTAHAALRALTQASAWPRVEIVMNYAGASGRMVDALVEQGVDGIVAAGTGNGSLSHALEAALLRARERGVAVVRSTRCANGRVLPHANDRLPHAPGLSPVKARIALLLDLLERQR